MKPTRTKKTKRVKSKFTFVAQNISNESYHADRKDSQGNFYLSSTKIKGALNGSLGFPERSQFGSMFHFIVEQTLKHWGKVKFHFCGRQDFKKEYPGKDIPNNGIIKVEGGYIIIDAPSNIKHYQQLQKKIQNVFIKHFNVDRGDNELMVEQSFFTDIKDIKKFNLRRFNTIIDPLLLSLHSFVVDNGISLKTRPDFVLIRRGPDGKKVIDLVDWKTTSKDSIEEQKNQAVYTYHYHISLYFYLLNLYYHGVVTNTDRVFIKIIFFNKTLVEIPVNIFVGDGGIFEGSARLGIKELMKNWKSYQSVQKQMKKDFIVTNITDPRKKETTT